MEGDKNTFKILTGKLTGKIQDFDSTAYLSDPYSTTGLMNDFKNIITFMVLYRRLI
jgi:hypothetical protein